MTITTTLVPKFIIKIGGFTLVELMITLLILTIIALFAFPAFTEIITKERIKGDTYRIYSSLQLAQEMAVLSDRPVAILPVGTYNFPTTFRPNDWSNKDTQQKMRQYWTGNNIVIGFIPEDIYYNAYSLELNNNRAAQFQNDIKTAWNNDSTLIIRKVDWITFAPLDTLNTPATATELNGLNRFDAHVTTAHAEFNAFEGRGIIIDPTGYAMTNTTFAFSTPLKNNAPSEQKIITKVGFCLSRFLENSNDNDPSTNNFIPHYDFYSSLKATDSGGRESIYCQEAY